jgi:hypothetical protein
MHLVGERQRWTIGKRQECARELFLFLCVHICTKIDVLIQYFQSRLPSLIRVEASNTAGRVP